MTCVKRVHYGCVKPTLVIIGLGNPGRQYEHTRHNVGFQAVDALSEAFGEGEWQEKQKYLSFVQEARIVTVPALLVKPQTYMNLSGNAVEKLMKFFELDSSSQMLVLCDDVDLDEKFGEHYARLRIGLGAQPPETDLATWVLSVPTEEEKKALQEAIKRIPELVKEYVVGEGADMSGSI